MESYRILYHLAVEHDYFKEQPCVAFQCSLAPQGKLLAKRRNLLFRQVAANEWNVYYDCMGTEPDTEHDVLEIEMISTDSSFPLYTEWEGFCPAISYVLQLPTAREKEEATSVILPSDGKRSIGMPFCLIRLQLTKELLDAARTDRPKSATLGFRSPSVQWEYLFLSRGNNEIPAEQLRLEDATGNMEFSPFNLYEAGGRTFWRTLSIERIPIQSVYESRLRLVAHADGNRQQRRILLSRVEPPLLGRFQSEEPGVLQQICYY